MARPKKENQAESEQTNPNSNSNEKLNVLDSILDRNKAHHYAFDNKMASKFDVFYDLSLAAEV